MSVESIDRDTAFWIIGFFFGTPVTILTGMLFIKIEAHDDQGDRSRSIWRLLALLSVVLLVAGAAVVLAINLTQSSAAVNDWTLTPAAGDVSMRATERPLATHTAAILLPTADPSPTSEPTETPPPIKTPEPTAEPTALAEPTPPPTATAEPTSEPTPTPPPAGTVLYEANSSESFAEWSSAGGWQTVSGMLVNDGSNETVAFLGAPYEPPVADYAVEVEMQWARGGETFGVVTRGEDDGGYWIGGNWDACYDEWYLFAWAGPAELSKLQYGTICGVGSPPASIILRTDTAIDADWHTYRIEVQGNVIRVLLDGILVTKTTDNRFLSAGEVGLWSNGAQVSVRRFSVIALGDVSASGQAPNTASTTVASNSGWSHQTATRDDPVRRRHTFVLTSMGVFFYTRTSLRLVRTSRTS